MSSNIAAVFTVDLFCVRANGGNWKLSWNYMMT